MTYNIKKYTSKTKFYNDIKEHYEEINPSALGISGGSSLSIFDHIRPEFDTEIFLVDERFVSEVDINSNCMQARLKIMSNINPWNVLIHNDIEKCIQEYENSLPYSFDLIILGVGSDGHTASLFPNTKALDSKELCAHTQTDKFDVKDRLTLTYEGIKKADNIFIVIINKPEVLRSIQDPSIDYKDFPIKKVINTQNPTIYYLEEN
ncbi:MAG: 6-phosphogluconolactonase (EC, eukaryotic type [uncultured Campylobacterales bacterium]|uniref:6-phosphogluconolactonase (EC, eukaryotic type) n=1 Tax=uncultured Campylobacterales bacterium TaxID=352960 RepID=A0A6S6SKD5_9BACT|nr:MAG: 6-phosphogluconolactonase (EC, eukaryotic type [uncultured Campylobacterales bacterium]